MNIDRTNLHDLLDAVLQVVIDDKDINLEPLFLKAIDNNKNVFDCFLNDLDLIKSILNEDVNFFLDSDPAASSIDEIKIAYFSGDTFKILLK